MPLYRRMSIMLVAMLALAIAAVAWLRSPVLLSPATPDAWPSTASPAALTDAATEAMIDALLAQMSIEEKVGQTIQAEIGSIKPEDLEKWPLGSILIGGNGGPGGDDRAPAAAWLQMAQRWQGASRKIPLLIGIDAVHGHNNIVGAVIFPHNIGLGAAGEPELVRRIGEATAEEVAATGIPWTFAPAVTVPQDARWGRTYEGWSERPEVVAAYAAAMTLGLQGDLVAGQPLAPGRVAATAKHFVGDGATHKGIDQGDARISEEELMRVHAPGYVTAIEAGTLTVMASFSSWNGEKMHGNRSLLTSVLKERMGFRGLVVGDWNGHEQVPGCSAKSCPASFNAGIDIFMAPNDWRDLFENTVGQVRDGEISAERLDDAVRRILRVKAKLGLFAGDRPPVDLSRIGAADHRELARESVRKSLVLLKNDGILPIAAGTRVLVAGPAADDIAAACGGWTLSWQGDGNTNADFPNGQSIWDGVREAVTAAGGVAERSVDGSFTERPGVAVVVFGEAPYAEGKGDRKNLDYEPKEALRILRALRAHGVPTVSVLLSGRPLGVDDEIEASDAFVAAWLPGTEGGGVADLLIGTGRDFQGRLAYGWPATGGGTAPRYPFGFGLTLR